jgi:hypothetical protein
MDPKTNPAAVAEARSTLPSLKRDAPAELIESIRQIEARADECFHSLKILGLPANLALWSLLVGSIRLVECEIDRRGDNTAHLDATLINASSLVSTAMKWVMKHGNHSSAIGRRNWTRDLAAKVEEAIALAHDYDGFLNALPLWHKNRYGVELLSPTHARFTVIGSDIDRRVSAYQKGFRPKTGRHRGERAQKLAPTAMVNNLFEQVYSRCRPLGSLGFSCNDPWKLWVELLPEYQLRVDAISRRDDALSLGNYTLGEFKKVYAALLAVCATQEHLCFAWGRNTKIYPHESVVMIRSLEEWSKIVSNLSGVQGSLCRSAIKDLSFDFSSSPNLHVCPFVPLDSSGRQMAVAPHFPLHSRPDENILWLCSKLRPRHFDTASLKKEPEMHAALEKACSRYLPQGPIRLPSPTPDIDLLLTDEDSSTVVIAELKWIRKPTKTLERIKRDEDVLKGFDQLRAIRQFLGQNPNHLVSIGKLRRSLNEYDNVQYAVIARDHWIWVVPTADVAIFTYDAFTASLTRSARLKDVVDDLLTYDWLPIEGRDYTVKYDKAYANGAEIEMETFYAL